MFKDNKMYMIVFIIIIILVDAISLTFAFIGRPNENGEVNVLSNFQYADTINFTVTDRNGNEEIQSAVISPSDNFLNSNNTTTSTHCEGLERGRNCIYSNTTAYVRLSTSEYENGVTCYYNIVYRPDEDNPYHKSPNLGNIIEYGMDFSCYDPSGSSDPCYTRIGQVAGISEYDLNSDYGIPDTVAENVVISTDSINEEKVQELEFEVAFYNREVDQSSQSGKSLKATIDIIPTKCVVN